VSRPGAILIPLLGGFLLTVAVVSWRSGWWRQSGALESPAAPTPKIEPRRSQLRVAHVTLSVDPWAPAPSVRSAPAKAAPAAAPQPAATPLAPPESSSGVLEAPVRRFARGSKAGGN
jgi:hypothetical protein